MKRSLDEELQNKEKVPTRIVRETLSNTIFFDADRGVAEEMLNHMRSENTIKRYAPETYFYLNYKIDHRFGQEWNCGNFLSIDDVFYFSTKSYGYSDLLNEFYVKMVDLNPVLNSISVKTDIEKLELLRGVGSGLHFNDVKYYIKDVKRHGKNKSIMSKILASFANAIYAFRYSENEKSKERRSEMGENGIEFVLSPKTSIRIILDLYYRK